jgi:hypothetical protein
MKNFLIVAFFMLSTLIIANGIEKMDWQIAVFGIFALLFDIALMFQNSIEEKMSKKL